MKFLILAALVVTSAIAAARVDRPANGIVITIKRTPAGDGKLMYANYCASCHGVYGKGNGPSAPLLKTRPSDLTALSKNNQGVFPLESVKSTLEFGAPDLQHQASEMPVWGPILNQMDTGYAGQLKGMERIVALTRYIESIQQK